MVCTKPASQMGVTYGRSRSDGKGPPWLESTRRPPQGNSQARPGVGAYPRGDGEEWPRDWGKPESSRGMPRARAEQEYYHRGLRRKHRYRVGRAAQPRHDAGCDKATSQKRGSDRAVVAETD